MPKQGGPTAEADESPVSGRDDTAQARMAIKLKVSSLFSEFLFRSRKSYGISLPESKAKPASAVSNERGTPAHSRCSGKQVKVLIGNAVEGDEALVNDGHPTIGSLREELIGVGQCLKLTNQVY